MLHIIIIIIIIIIMHALHSIQGKNAFKDGCVCLSFCRSTFFNW
jgi:hypothetical protein